MPAPLIGLTGRTVTADQIPVMPEVLAGFPIDLYFVGYARAVIEAGGIPVFLPLAVDPDAVVARLDGLLLTGGADIDPARYGQAPAADLYGPEPERDAFELAALDAALTRSVPVLAICRGIQLLNVAAGGTLHQHVPEHSRFDVSPDTLTDEVVFTQGSTLHDLYGPSRKVNSLHHQTIDAVGDGYRVVGRTPSGEIEALEAETGDVIGVQWHPEMMAGRADDPIFTWLVDRAAGAAGGGDGDGPGR